MPKSAFSAIEKNLSSILGGAEVMLIENKGDEPKASADDADKMVFPLELDYSSYLFCAQRKKLSFTAIERKFISELLIAFQGLYVGFSAEGYAAHFRTALLTSLTDIAVARFLRGDGKGAFWPVQSLIQLLKNLSYQRYEGTPATTGFLIYRNKLDDFFKSLKDTRYGWIDLDKNRRRVAADFFQNPLSYRFVDGQRALFVGDIRMNIKGTIRSNSPVANDNIERLANRETLSLLNKAGKGSFAVFVNKYSEVEVVLDNDKFFLWRKGYWGIFDPEIMREFFSGKLEKRATDHLIWTIYALSKARHGTVVLVADQSTNLNYLHMGSVGGRDPLSRALISHIRGTKIGTLKRSGELSRILSSDGLTVINRKGELLDTGVIIDTSKVKDLVTGGGRTTAAIAASYFGSVVKVSEDGPIDLYRNGHSFYRFG